MSEQKEAGKQSGAVLLDRDRHSGVLGWGPTMQGEGRFNHRGFGMLWITLWKLAGGARKWLYEQPMIFENPGGIIIATTPDGRIALVRTHRKTGPRINQDHPSEQHLFGDGMRTLSWINNYLTIVNRSGVWDKLVESLGSWRFETMRGIVDQEMTDQDIERYVLGAAKQEGLEEGGVKVRDARVVAPINTNTTWFAHSQMVAFGVIEEIGDQKPEDLEVIGQMMLFTPGQIRTLIQRDLLDCGTTLAALAVCGIQIPLEGEPLPEDLEEASPYREAVMVT